jgi:hypothetical protein
MPGSGVDIFIRYATISREKFLRLPQSAARNFHEDDTPYARNRFNCREPEIRAGAPAALLTTGSRANKVCFLIGYREKGGQYKDSFAVLFFGNEKNYGKGEDHR